MNLYGKHIFCGPSKGFIEFIRKNIVANSSRLNLFFALSLIIMGCTNPEKATYPVKAYIPAEISDKVLVTTFPRCHYNHNTGDAYEFSTKMLRLNFQAKTFSGNVSDDFLTNYHCPSEKLGMVFYTDLQPLYEKVEKVDGQIIKKVVRGKEYLYFPTSKQRIQQSIPHIDYFFVDSTQAMLIIDGMPNQTTPIKLVFTTYDGIGNSSFYNYYSIHTIIDSDFQIKYQIRIMNEAYNQRFNLNPNKNDTKFAQEFKDVIISGGNILDHPEIIQGFVDNNEQVIKFFEAHREIITKAELDKINNTNHTEK